MTNSIFAALEEDLEPHAAHLTLDLATAYLAHAFRRRAGLDVASSSGHR